MMRTYQSRPRLTTESEVALAAYAVRYSRAERCLFSHLSAGEDAGKLKSSFMREHDLTARQFNALAFSVKGKIKSLIEGRNKLIADLKERISWLEYRLSEKLELGTNKYHQKRRKLAALRGRLAGLEQDQKSGRVRMCFGGRRLFRAQFNLAQNGYRDHAAWKRDWENARSREVFVIGSKDETAGCQGCQLVPVGDGLFSVKLRLPNTDDNKFAVFQATFSYGAKELKAALDAHKAISFRFLRDPKGWRMFVSTDMDGSIPIRLRKGAVGVDLNEDHLAVTEADASGNPVATYSLPLVTYGCTTEQANDRIGVAVKQVIEIAKAARRPLAIEKLDFASKKKELKDSGVRYARMFSNLSYGRIHSTIRARAFDAGIALHEVSPAYTSVIGRNKFARRYGLSSHGAAALVIARRALKLSERPNPHSDHNTSPVPVRKRGEHVWSFWAKVLRRERRLQRPVGRSQRAIQSVPHGTGRTQPAGSGATPGRQSAGNTVRPASING